MKKTIAFSLGLIMLGLAVFPFVQASRLRYHQYLYQKRQEQSQKTEGLRRRNAPINQEWESGESSVKSLNGKYMRGHQNVGYSHIDTRNNYSKQRQYYGNYPERPMSDRIRYYENRKPYTYERFSTAVAPSWDAVKYFATFENHEFSALMPVGWFLAQNDPYLFKNPESDYQIRVKKFDMDTCDTAYNFQACALKLSKSENNLLVPGRGKLSIVSPITRQAGWSDTVLNNLNVQTQTYTEAFVAKETGPTNYYYNRYYVSGIDGKIYLVETRVEYEKAPHYIQASKTIFDSLRVFGQ